MPRKEIDYSKTVIYKIVCNDLNIKDCYVGHTTEFTKRKNAHKFNSSREASKTANMRVYQTIKSHGGWDNWTMIEIEKFPCKDGNEARSKERFWYEQLNASLNMCKPLKTTEEYAEDSAMHKKNWNSQFGHDYNLNYRVVHKEKLASYREANRAEFNRKQNEKRAQKRAEKKALSQQST